MSSQSANAYQLTNMEQVAVFSDNRDMLRIYFTFEQQLLPAVIGVYIPTSIIVVISFISTWMSVTACHARVVLIVLCQNVMISLMTSMRSKTSKLTYPTAMDVWFITCMLFIGLNLFEFAIAYSFHVSCINL